MKVIETDIADVKLLVPKVFEDQRGFFLESYNQKTLDQALGKKVSFVQDNHSRSSYGTLRGLHYQLNNPQGKLVRVVKGEVFDVAVDMRKSSKTFGKWIGALLSSENKQMLWVPEGFAHGFLVLSESADFLYKTTNFYDPSSECTIFWNDPSLNIAWPQLSSPPILSKKDLEGSCFKEAKPFP